MDICFFVGLLTLSIKSCSVSTVVFLVDSRTSLSLNLRLNVTLAIRSVPTFNKSDSNIQVDDDDDDEEEGNVIQDENHKQTERITVWGQTGRTVRPLQAAMVPNAKQWQRVETAGMFLQWREEREQTRL